MKSRLEQFLELVKNQLKSIKARLIRLKKVTKKEPILMTKKVNVGTATLVVKLVGGLTVTGFLKGSPEKDLEDSLLDVHHSLNSQPFITLDTQDAVASVPTSNIALIKTYKSDHFVEVTYYV